MHCFSVFDYFTANYPADDVLFIDITHVPSYIKYEREPANLPAASCRFTAVILVSHYIMDINSTEYDPVHAALLHEIKSIDIPCVYLVYVGHHNVYVNRKRHAYPIIKIGVSSGAYARVNTQLKAEFGYARLVYYHADPCAQKIETRCKNDDRFKNNKVDVFKSNGTGSKECMALSDDWTLDAMKTMIKDVAASFIATDADHTAIPSDDHQLRLKMLDLEIAKQTVEIAKQAVEKAKIEAETAKFQRPAKQAVETAQIEAETTKSQRPNNAFKANDDNGDQRNDPVHVWIDAHIKPYHGEAFNRADAWRLFTTEHPKTKKGVFISALRSHIGCDARPLRALSSNVGWKNYRLLP